VRSSRVVLAEHVGHTVTATAVVSNTTMHNMKEDTKEMAKDSGMTKTNAEHGHLKVTELKMVSDSCKESIKYPTSGAGDLGLRLAFTLHDASIQTLILHMHERIPRNPDKRDVVRICVNTSLFQGTPAH
jgi:hypothetical protein